MNSIGHRTYIRILALVATGILSTGCTLWVGSNNETLPSSEGEGEGEGEGNPFELGDLGNQMDAEVTDPNLEPPVGPACDAASPALAESVLRERFSADIHPLMTRPIEEGGCMACHTPTSGRVLTVTESPDETFVRLQSAQMLVAGPSAMLGRIESQSMPPGGPFWNTAQVANLSSFICEMEKLEDETGLPPDEIFPPALNEPYGGEDSTEYDNTFLTYDQLRGRVEQVFGDDWVRDGTDFFEDNISLFGGVNFSTAFTPARGATAEFLIALSTMAEDVCYQAAQNGSGPFAGLDLAAPLRGGPGDEVSFGSRDFESIQYDGTPRDTPFSVNDEHMNVFSRGAARARFTASGTGEYRIVVRAEGQEAGPEIPRMSIRVGSEITPFSVPANGFNDYTVTYTVEAGARTVDALFENDYYDAVAGEDRNLKVASISVEGPLGVGEGGAESETRERLSTLFERILSRPPLLGDTDNEVDGLYEILIALDNFGGDRFSTYAGVCEALVQHQDFLFTRPPSADFNATPTERGRALLIKSALDTLDRTPTLQELEDYDNGTLTREELVDQWLLTDDFRDAYFHKMRIMLETDGSDIGNEPARLMTHVFLEDKPIKDILIAEYSVDENFEELARPDEHGATGLLTMKGFIVGKPGLPHYNYPARVLQGFMGMVFEPPTPETLAERDTATAASTVDTASACFTCHKILTPLAHQRLRWDEEGNYRETDDEGNVIDDSDQDLVAGYPYPGQGLESFSSVAVRKEGFLRRQINLQFSALFSRPMRHELDERIIYRDLWQEAANGNGSARDILKGVLFHPSYINPVGTDAVGEE